MTALVPVRRLADVRTGKIVNREPSTPADVEAPYVTAANVQPLGRVIEVDGKSMWFTPKELASTCGIRGGDLLVVEGGAGFGRPGIVPQEFDGWGFQNHINRIRPREGLADARFLYFAFEHLLSSGQTAVVAQGATFPTLSSEKVRSLGVPHMPQNRQRAIADFLDRETAQIDAMIEAQRQLVAGLEERQRAVQAETARPYLWAGERLKSHLTESDVRAGAAAGDHILLSVSIDWGVRPRDDSVHQEASDDLSNYKLVREGDIVVNRMRAFQGALGRSPQTGLVSPDYSVFRPRSGIDSRWLAAVMKSPPFVGEMASRIRGIGSVDAGQVRTPRINSADLLGIRLEVPMLAEQRRCLEMWVEEDERMMSLVDAANDSIALMQERRAALISAAVTGRIDPCTGRDHPAKEN